MEDRYVNVESIVREMSDQIRNDVAFINRVVNATKGAADPKEVVYRMLGAQYKAIMGGVVKRFLDRLAEAESRQSDSVH